MSNENKIKMFLNFQKIIDACFKSCLFLTDIFVRCWNTFYAYSLIFQFDHVFQLFTFFWKLAFRSFWLNAFLDQQLFLTHKIHMINHISLLSVLHINFGIDTFRRVSKSTTTANQFKIATWSQNECVNKLNQESSKTSIEWPTKIRNLHRKLLKTWIVSAIEMQIQKCIQLPDFWQCLMLTINTDALVKNILNLNWMATIETHVCYNH